MKPILAAITLLLALLPSAYSSDAKLDEFKSQLESALTAKNMPALNKLIYTKGVSSYQIDQTVFSIESNYSNSMVFGNVSFQALNDPTINPKAVDWMVNGQVMNGHKYIPNLKPLYICTMDFKDAKSGKNRGGVAAPIGLAPDGSFKFAQMVTQDAAANP